MRPDITSLFPAHIRARGRAYFTANRVALSDVADGVATGQVLGSRLYTVSVRWTNRGLISGDCNCPAYDDYGPCKHLWAMMLLLETTTSFLDRGTEAVRRHATPATSHPRIGRKPAPPAHRPAAWKRTLAEAARAITAGASRAPQATWPANRRINYIIDAAATLGSAEGVVVELATQTLDRHGAWGPPRAMIAKQEEWLANPDPLDRQIAQMLLGTRTEHTWFQPSARRRYAVSEASYDTTLRLMCETGRCRIRAQVGEPALHEASEQARIAFKRHRSALY